MGCTQVVVAPTTWPTEGCTSAAVTVAGEGWRTDVLLERPDGVQLAMANRFPEGPECVAAVVYAPPGFDPGLDRVGEAQALALADAGFATFVWDPRGRGESAGEEDANGFLSQDDFAAVVRWAASQASVDPTRVLLYSRSFGGTLAAGALARDTTLAPLGWVDFESPGWLSDDLAYATEHTAERVQSLADASGDPEVWFSEREAAGFMGDVAVPYHRAQGNPDHALTTLQAAIAMVNGATSSPAVRLNGVLITEPLTEETVAAGAGDDALDPGGEAMTAALIAAFAAE